MASPRQTSPMPSRWWSGCRSRAPRPIWRTANPTVPASTIHAAVTVRNSHLARMTTGLRLFLAARRLLTALRFPRPPAPFFPERPVPPPRPPRAPRELPDRAAVLPPDRAALLAEPRPLPEPPRAEPPVPPVGRPPGGGGGGVGRITASGYSLAS